MICIYTKKKSVKYIELNAINILIHIVFNDGQQ